jgi:hypothetical protein
MEQDANLTDGLRRSCLQRRTVEVFGQPDWNWSEGTDLSLAKSIATAVVRAARAAEPLPHDDALALFAGAARRLGGTWNHFDYISIEDLLRDRARERLTEMRLGLFRKYQETARFERSVLRFDPTGEAESIAQQAMSELDRQFRALPPILRNEGELDLALTFLRTGIRRMVEDLANSPKRGSEWEYTMMNYAKSGGRVMGLV